MKRRLFGGTTLAALYAPVAAALPAVLRRPAPATPLSTGAALLAAARAGHRLVLAGERGIVLTSDDNGQRWTQAQVPVQVSLTALAFADERNGWACGHFGVLLRTADAGSTWTLALDGARAAQLTLQAAGDAAQRQAAQRLVEEGPDKPWFDVHVHGSHLFAVGAYGLALQARGGAALQSAPRAGPARPAPRGGSSKVAEPHLLESLAQRLPNPRQLHLHGVRMVGELVFIVGEQGLLLRSSDRGASFEALASPYKGSFFGVLATASGSVLAYGLRGNILRSGDAGNSWVPVSNPVPAGISAAIQRSDGSIVLAAQNGDLLLSRDDGQTFQRRPAAAPFPAAAVVQADGDWLVMAGLRGVQRHALG